MFARIKRSAHALLALNNLRNSGKSALSDTNASSEYRHNPHFKLHQVAHDNRKAGGPPKPEVAWVSTESSGPDHRLSLSPDRE